MLECHARDADRQLAHLGEVREPHLAGLMDLAEDNLLIPTV